MRPLAAVGVAALLSASCGAPLMKLPAGPGAPAPDAGAAVAEATRACGAVASITAEVAVSGSVGGRRMRGRLHVGLAAPASARLEAVAPFGQPLFILVSRGGDATLLLTRENRVLPHGRPDAVLEAVTGVPLDAADLRTVLTGCAAVPDAVAGRQLGDLWRVVSHGERLLYVQRESPRAAWQLVAVVMSGSVQPGWRAEYRDFHDGLPRTIRLTSRDSERFDLRLSLSQVDLNVPLAPDAFEVRVPATAAEITLDELRDSGPLANARDSDGA